MINPVIEKFVEENNMDYLFLLLANLEVERLSKLPIEIKKKFKRKITEVSLENVATNRILDYLDKYKEDIDLAIR